MEKLHFHCQNCTRNEVLFNITCIEKVKERIDTNLYTIISYNTCDNCKELLKELDIHNYCDVQYYHYHRCDPFISIYNLKLIEQYGFFEVFFWGDIEYASYNTTINNLTNIDKKFMFDAFISFSSCTNTVEIDYDVRENWDKIDKKIMFDSIKDGSLIRMERRIYPYDSTFIECNLEKIKDKGYEVNLIQIVDEIVDSTEYYIVKKPTLTKPARKM